MKLLALFLLAAQATRPLVTVEEIEGRQWWSVRAKDASLVTVLDAIAERSGRRLEGSGLLTNGALVTVELDRRPLSQVLEYVVGTSGHEYEFDADTITLREPLARSAQQELTRASAAWLRASSRFPAHAMAPNARLSQGELAELQGELGVAREHYETLVETFPSAPEVAEATMRTGLVLQRMGSWSEASLRFRALASLKNANPYHATARLELARCSIELGDPQSALHLLSALDANYPTADEVESTGRLLVKARALNALDRPMEALRTIDRMEASFDPLAEREAMRVRARALDGIGMPAESSTAWLLYGGEASGAERVLALREAARLALEADDELGVLFVCREAERFGLVEELGPYWHQARVRLGLADDVQDGGDVSTRLEAAEAHLEKNEAEKAAVLLEPMFLARGALQEPQALRLLLAWADTTDQRFGIDQAVRVLAEERAGFASASARAAVDAAAARLFERRGLFERAVDAYEGRY